MWSSYEFGRRLFIQMFTVLKQPEKGLWSSLYDTLRNQSLMKGKWDGPKTFGNIVRSQNANKYIQFSIMSAHLYLMALNTNTWTKFITNYIHFCFCLYFSFFFSYFFVMSAKAQKRGARSGQDWKWFWTIADIGCTW